MADDLDVTLRPLMPDDLAEVGRLHARAFAALAATHHTPVQIAAHTALTGAPDYADDLRRSHLTLAVSAIGGIVGSAGWIAVAEEPATARIRKVFVDPALARRGLATRLVSAAEAQALAQGHRRLIVRANVNAVPLYQRLGYVSMRSGTMDTPDGVALPVAFMTKTPA